MMLAMVGHNEPKNRDWIAVYRSLRTHPIIGFLNPDGTRKKGAVVCETMAWVDLCMQANWKDLREDNKGHPVIVERGQLQGGRNWLADRWGWSEKKVRVFLKKLTNDKMIILGPAKGPTERPTRKNTTNIITICNYDIYQTSIEILNGMRATERTSEGASEGPARGHTVTKEQDNKKKDTMCSEGLHPVPDKPKRRSAKTPPESYSDDFEAFWRLYPRKKGKGEASVSWERLSMVQKRKAYLSMKAQLPEMGRIIAEKGPNFCPMPATWINQGRFDDEVEAEHTPKIRRPIRGTAHV